VGARVGWQEAALAAQTDGGGTEGGWAWVDLHECAPAGTPLADWHADLLTHELTD
jgi:hypothetical protein